MIVIAAAGLSSDSPVGPQSQDSSQIDRVFDEWGFGASRRNGALPTVTDWAGFGDWAAQKVDLRLMTANAISGDPSGNVAHSSEGADRRQIETIARDHAIQTFERHAQHERLALDLARGLTPVSAVSSVAKRPDGVSGERVSSNPSSAALSYLAVAATGAVASFLPRPGAEARGNDIRLKRRRASPRRV